MLQRRNECEDTKTENGIHKQATWLGGRLWHVRQKKNLKNY